MFTFKFRSTQEFKLLVVDVFDELNESKLKIKGINFQKESQKILII